MQRADEQQRGECLTDLGLPRWERGGGGECGGASEIGLAFAKHLPSRWRRCRFRKGLGLPIYEGKVPENADVAKWQTQRT
jgi:hypothetical protein